MNWNSVNKKKFERNLRKPTVLEEKKSDEKKLADQAVIRLQNAVHREFTRRKKIETNA